MSPSYHGPSTLDSFWEMIYEENVSTIVCLSKSGKGISMFAKYWPDDSKAESPGKCYGRYMVKLKEEQVLENDSLVERTLAVRKAVEGEYRAEKTVVQLQSLSWANYSVPSSPHLVLPLFSRLHRLRESYSKNECKTLVHCSGGVGRSGTFLAVYQGLSGTIWKKDWKVGGSDTERNKRVQTSVFCGAASVRTLTDPRRLSSTISPKTFPCCRQYDTCERKGILCALRA